MSTFTLTDAETGLVVVATDDAAEVRAKIEEALSYEPAPSWFRLTVRFRRYDMPDGTVSEHVVTLNWQQVLRWDEKGRQG